MFIPWQTDDFRDPPELIYWEDPHHGGFGPEMGCSDVVIQIIHVGVYQPWAMAIWYHYDLVSIPIQHHLPRCLIGVGYHDYHIASLKHHIGEPSSIGESRVDMGLSDNKVPHSIHWFIMKCIHVPSFSLLLND